MQQLKDFKKIAIVGTAPSWCDTPWNDADLGIYSLNDAYNIAGFQRADFWADMHPLNKFWYAPKKEEGKQVVVFSHQIPYGYYVRPAGHLDWLATQPMVKYLHPEHAQQLPESATWPNAHPFPRADVEASYGRYQTSSPQWMLAQVLMAGIREVHIYGIHLSTEQEYIEQRPGFEYLIGCLLGPTKRTMTVKDKLRRYESQDGLVVLPEASPVLAAGFQYAFEPSPRRALEPLKWELHKAEIKLTRRLDALKRARWPITKLQEPIPNDPHGAMQTRTLTISTLQQEVRYYEAMVQDCQDALGRAQAGV